uniref:Uncharacterized protein n=1 Tax=Arundo donax TaxID=35708 RepID=A0A0A9HI27_ARUDO
MALVFKHGHPSQQILEKMEKRGTGPLVRLGLLYFLPLPSSPSPPYSSTKESLSSMRLMALTGTWSYEATRLVVLPPPAPGHPCCHIGALGAHSVQRATESELVLDFD